MESDHRYYSRRAVQERMAAARAITTSAREWHKQLSEDFSRKAEEMGAFSPAQ